MSAPLVARDTDKVQQKMSEHTSLESAQTMLCALTGQFAHQTCLQFQHVYDIF